MSQEEDQCKKKLSYAEKTACRAVSYVSLLEGHSRMSISVKGKCEVWACYYQIKSNIFNEV